MEQNSREGEGAELVSESGVVARAEPLELRSRVTEAGLSEMFNNMFHDFEDDPFFREPFHAHQEHMNKTMRHFSDGFQLDPFFGKNRQLEPGSSFSDDRRVAEPMDPFKHMENMLSNMGSRMFDMRGIIDEQPSNSNGHSFHSSTVKTYSKLGDKPAKLFQATSQTRQAPGGIKETRKAIRNSDTGEEKLRIGHHICDRGHVIERSKNEKSGASEVNQEFINVDENEAGAFDQEWENQVASFGRGGPSARPSRTSVNRGLEPGAQRSQQYLNNNTHGNVLEMPRRNENGMPHENVIGMVQGNAYEMQNRNSRGKQ